MNISGLGESIVESLVESNLINNFVDLYKLSTTNLLSVDRMAEKSSNKLITSITKSKNTSFDKLIYALGIKEVGITTAQNLSKTYMSLDSLMSATCDELCLIDDIGEIVAENIFNYFNNSKNIKLINELINLGISIHYQKVIINSKFVGNSYVVTGSFNSKSRQEIEKIIVENGGKVTGSISKNTTALVLGSNPGSKYEKAKKLNIAIIREEDFLKLL